MNDVKQPRSGLRRLFGFLLRPSTISLGAVLVIGVVAGIIFWGGFNTGMEATNTLQFCTTCHEMRDTVYEEYKSTIHYTNRTGVRAICSDCHVPRDWVHKVIRKVKATGEVYAKVTGFVDTPEKFEKHRIEMAQREWAQMKASDSRECRNCHAWDAMAKSKQRPKAQTKHAAAQKEGKTCIDCHKGIAHLLPKEYEEEE